jgi:hypothetical protein
MAQQPLFGYSPEQIMQARQAAMQERAAAEARNVGGGWAPLYEQARGLSMMGAEALGRGLFPQAQDPALQRAQVTQSIVQKYRGQDINDPDVLRSMATDFSSAGLNEIALQLGEESKKRVGAQPDPKKQAESIVLTVGQIPEEQRTTAQKSMYNAAQNLLSPGSSKSNYRMLTSAEARARGLDPTKTYQLEVGSNKVSQVGQDPSVVFNAPLVGAQNKYAEGVGKARAERDISQFGSAEAAVENLTKINEIIGELRTGDQFTGAFADIQKNIQKVQAKFAADKKAGKRVSDTEYLDALLGSDVFPMIGALGIGARGLDTPAEREFLRQVMTGTINLEKDTLVRLTEQRKRIAEKAIERFNNRVDKGELNEFFKYQGITPQKFEIPKPPEPVRAQPSQPGQWRIVR